MTGPSIFPFLNLFIVVSEHHYQKSSRYEPTAASAAPNHFLHQNVSVVDEVTHRLFACFQA